MISTMMRYLSICVIVSGCCSIPPAEISIPDCDYPPAITESVWNDLGLMREALSRDALIYEACIQKYRGRIEAFNEDS